VPELVKAVKDGSKEALLSFLHKETDSGIYSLEVFTMKFCECVLPVGLLLNRP
jgi:hypothetical protein